MQIKTERSVPCSNCDCIKCVRESVQNVNFLTYTQPSFDLSPLKDHFSTFEHLRLRLWCKKKTTSHAENAPYGTIAITCNCQMMPAIVILWSHKRTKQQEKEWNGQGYKDKEREKIR